MRSLLASVLALALFAAPAGAQLPLTGVGPGGFGSSAAVYDPGGVVFHMEGSATYTAGAGNLNGGTDTNHLIVAFRRKAQFGYPSGTQGASQWRSSMSFGTYGDGTCAGESCRGYMINEDAASWTGSGAYGTGWTLRNTMADTNNFPGWSASALSKTLWGFNAEWESVVEFADTAPAANSRKTAIFRNGVLGATQNNQTDTGAGFLINWNAPQGLCINYCNRTSGLQTGGMVELADIIVVTVAALPAGCPATPANCQSVVDAFYNSATGKPVNPGTNSTNCTAFMTALGAAGTLPEMCLRGDKTNFLSNAGGDPAVHTMSVVNGIAASPKPAAIYNSAYGQGNEPTDRPFFAWSATMSTSNVSTSSSASCVAAQCESNVSGNFGHKINTNDLLIVPWSNCYTSSAPSATLPTLSTGWNWLTSSTNTNPTNDTTVGGGSQRCAFGVAYHVASANYVANNTPWQAGNPFVDPPTISYTSTGTAPRQVSFTMYAYRKADGTTPQIDVSDCTSMNKGAAGATQPFVLTSVTTTAATTTLISLLLSKANNLPVAPPASADLRNGVQYAATGNPIITMADEKLTSSGATGTRTFTQYGSFSNNERGYGCLIALKN